MSDITTIDGSVRHLWSVAVSEPVPLLRVLAADPLVAVFDERGFFLSDEAFVRFLRVRDLPHLYAARLSSENAYYFGISNQKGGRWKRGHAYHLGTLAHTLLNTTVHYDQNHAGWIAEWFEPFTGDRQGDLYVVRMREPIAISFSVYASSATKQQTNQQLRTDESRLIKRAIEGKLVVLNIKV